MKVCSERQDQNTNLTNAQDRTIPHTDMALKHVAQSQIIFLLKAQEQAHVNYPSPFFKYNNI